MPPVKPIPPSDDHDHLIQLNGEMIALVQHMDMLVESVKATSESMKEMQKAMQDHAGVIGHQVVAGNLELLNHKINLLEEDNKKLKTKAEDSESNWRIVKFVGAMILPVFTGVTILVVKIFFHL